MIKKAPLWGFFIYKKPINYFWGLMNYNRTNTIIGWLVFGLALLVYALTLEPYVSYWDCGEFISASYGLQVVHPPGAPLYQMLGRLFSLFAFGNTAHVAFAINMLSAVASAFCALFTYFITTHIAKKIVSPVGLPLVKNQAIMVWGAGVVAALTIAFSDTFWFSAVEAEVYALSSFFTMLVFWAALRWHESQNNRPRWLVFIAFAVGLSIGVHLLNLLVVPAVVLVIYFGYRTYSFLNFLVAAIIGLAVLLSIQFLIIPGIPALAAITDRWFVNGLNTNIGTGAIVFFISVFAVLIVAVIVSRVKHWVNLHLAVFCLVFVLVGYSSYLLVPIRSAAHPPININTPDDAFSFVSYLNREQYGSRPLLHGPYFNAPITEFKMGKPYWRPVNGKYEIVGHGNEYVFDPEYTTFFPRMGDLYSSSSKAGYIGWTGVDPEKPPVFTDNLSFFFKYQFLHMYVRYHLWNFAGRQNNRQGYGNAIHGNGVSGIAWFDNFIAAPNDNLPTVYARNKARNYYFFLPLLLGLAGLFYHSSKNKYGFWPLFVLFLFTGAFLAIYLNGPPFEPRERDYVFVGSFQVFSVWVGLGALWLMRKLHQFIKQGIWIGLAAALLASPLLLISQNWDDHDRSGRSFARDYAKNCLQNLAPNAVLFVYGDNDTYPLWYLQNVEGFRKDVRVINANLLNTDWAAFDLVRTELGSQPLKLTITPQQYQNDMRDLLRINTPGDTAITVLAALQYAAQDTASQNIFKYASGRVRINLPCGNLFIPINKEKTNGWVTGPDTAYRVSRFEIPITSTSIFRAGVLMLDIIANNYYERPIYFSSFNEAENLPQLNKYLRLEGLAYRLLPLQYPDSTEYFNRINTAQMDTLLSKFALAGYNNPQLFVEPEAISIAYHYRNLFSHTAEKLMAEGNTQKAAALSQQCISYFPVNLVDYKYHKPALVFLKALYLAKQTPQAEAFYATISNQLMQKAAYFNSLNNTIAQYEGRAETQKAITSLTELKNLLLLLQQDKKAAEIEAFLGFYPKPATQE
jgi:hypothetical protein